jgi:hypothetical protein
MDGGAAPRKAKLRPLPAPVASRFDSITRDSCIWRVRHLVKLYRLHALLAQELFDRAGIESLDDAELSALVVTIERAADCCNEGIPLHEAGLLRNDVWRDF